jgi:protease II
MKHDFFDSRHTLKLMKQRCLSKSKTKKQLKSLLKENPYKYFSKHEILKTNNSQKCDRTELLKIKQKNVLNPAVASTDESQLSIIRKLRNETLNTVGRKHIKKQHSLFKSINSTYFENHFGDSIFTKTNNQKDYSTYELHDSCNMYKLLDINEISKGFDYFQVKNVTYSPSKSRISFCVDIIGDRNYHLVIKDLIQNKLIVVDLSNKNERFVSVNSMLSSENTNKRQMSENYIWIDDDSLIYITHDSYYNVKKCYTFNIETKKRRLIFSEKRNRMLSLSSTDNGNRNNVEMNYIILYSSSYNDDEVFIIDVLNHKLYTNMKKVQLIDNPVLKSQSFVRYDYINHINGRWYIMKQKGAKYVMLMSHDFKTFKSLFHIDAKYDVVTDVDYHLNKFVVLIKSRGSYKIKVYDLCRKVFYDVGHERGDDKSCICSIKNSCHLSIMPSWTDSSKLLLKSTSFTHPGKLFFLNMGMFDEKAYVSDVTDNVLIASNRESLKYDKSYHEKTIFLKNHTIMCTLIYKKGMKLKNEKCLLYGYGSYGDSFNASYDFLKLTKLCDKGFVVVIAYISGDNALGHQQYVNGMGLNKHNTFDDFIYIAEKYLFKNKITSKDKLAIWGRSAGGLLIGSVINKKPDICNLAIMGVPFLTPLKTLSSQYTPLGFESHSEWGDPRNKKVEKYIKSYSPIENIEKCSFYPNILIYANMNDTLTPYKETMMYYDKIKNANVFESGERDLLIHIDEKYGHVQGSSKSDANYIYALIFSALDKYIK